MEIMTASEFVVELGKGRTRFVDLEISGHVCFKNVSLESLSLEQVSFSGDVDFGDLVLKRLEIYHSNVVGKVTGTLKCSDTTVRSNICSYGSTISFWLNESILQDFFD